MTQLEKIIQDLKKEIELTRSTPINYNNGYDHEAHNDGYIEGLEFTIKRIKSEPDNTPKLVINNLNKIEKIIEILNKKHKELNEKYVEYEQEGRNLGYMDGIEFAIATIKTESNNPNPKPMKYREFWEKTFGQGMDREEMIKWFVRTGIDSDQIHNDDYEKNPDVSFKIGDAEVDLFKCFKELQSQLDRMVEERAIELVETKLKELLTTFKLYNKRESEKDW